MCFKKRVYGIGMKTIHPLLGRARLWAPEGDFGPCAAYGSVLLRFQAHPVKLIDLSLHLIHDILYACLS